jgi:hypothetical protein
MALEKFRAPAIPLPPNEYNRQQFDEIFRALRIYFNNLDSLTPNQADSYRADNFFGGDLSVDDATAKFINAIEAVVETATINTITNNYGKIQSLLNNRIVSKDVMAANFYGGMFHGDGRFISTPYNQFESLVDQTAPNVATANALELEVTNFADSISITGANDTRITFSEKGIYFVTYNIQFKSVSNDGEFIDIWIRYNGNDYPQSNTRFYIPPRRNNTDPAYLVAVTTIAGDAVNDGDYVEIMWRVSNTDVTIEHLPAVTASPGVTPDIPETPSAIVQASFISAQFPPGIKVAPLSVYGYGQLGSVTITIT